MTEETGAAAPEAALAPVAPTEIEQATPTDPSVAKADTAPENAEPKADEQGEDSEPKRLTRNQRLQRKAARLSTMVAEQAAELEKLRQATDKSGKESEPKEADYNGDWTRYQADYAAWKATNNIRGVLLEKDQRDAETRLKERRQEASDEFLERAEQTKTQIPDYDKVVEAFYKSGGQFAPHVIEELIESDRGPELAYHIAKSPGLATSLNAQSPRDVAREIGRLEAKVSLPQPKRQTQAPAPIAPLTGGSAGVRDVHALAKSDDISAYIKMRNEEDAARRR